MKDECSTGTLAWLTLKASPRTHWISFAVLIVGIVSIGMLIWSMRINQAGRANFATANSIMDMRTSIASFHLRFDDHLFSDRSQDIQAIWAYLLEGISLANTIEHGGAGEHGLAVDRLEGMKYRAEIHVLQALLSRLESLAEERLKDPLKGKPGSELDGIFDDVYKEFMLKAGALEGMVEKEEFGNQHKSERVFKGTLLVWAFIVIAMVIGSWWRENRRMAAERALQAQTEELQRHRFHLTDMVEDRTAELISANRDLQSEIAQHRQTLTELEASKSRFEKLSLEFHALLDAIPDSLTLFSSDLKILWANRGAASVLGREVSDLPGNHCFRLRGHGSPCEGCPVLKAFETEKTEGAQITGRDGSVWDVRAFPIRNNGGKVSSVIEVATDITEKTALQAESIRIAHLASLGELAAGVAHEINNPINGIINCAQILLDEMGGPNGENEIPGMIIKEGNRIGTIVRSLLSFARENRTEKKPVSLGEPLSHALSLLGKQLEKDGITLRVDVSDDLPLVTANPQQIEQVFLNVINNSRHALNLRYPEADERKTIEIVGRPVSLNGRATVGITVHDTGTGIPAGIIDKIMHPFFSTKPQGAGTGLGLSISHGIVSDHGGKLQIQSVEGEYTKTHILLPAV